MSNNSTIMISKTINQLAVATLIGALAWVLFSIYNAIVVEPTLDLDPTALVPINDNIDRKILLEIAKRDQLGIDVDAKLLESQVASETGMPEVAQ